MTIEEIIKVLDEIAEGFENLSAEVCARNDLRALWEGRAKGIRQAIALLKTHPEAQPNEPLTLEELRGMDGEPVYIVHKNSKYTRWYIWNNKPVDDIHDGLDGYGVFWSAYRRPPKED